MADIRLVTDSACDLPPEVIERHHIEVVPLSIRFGEREYVDRQDFTPAEFWELCATSDTLPETAAPSPGAFEAAYRRLLDDGAEGILVVSLSGALSATIEAAQQAARTVAGDIGVEVVDSRSVSMGLGALVVEAAELVTGAASAGDVAAAIRVAAARTRVYGALDTLENLKKGGRIGGAQALLGSLLSIKPIVDISSGVTEEAGKARTRKKALEVLRDKVAAAGAVEHLCITHGLAPEVDAMLDLLAPLYPRDDIRIGIIGPVIGAHGGPRVLGVTWVAPG
jgi:DegV family protein with EDD domain